MHEICSIKDNEEQRIEFPGCRGRKQARSESHSLDRAVQVLLFQARLVSAEDNHVFVAQQARIRPPLRQGQLSRNQQLEASTRSEVSRSTAI